MNSEWIWWARAVIYGLLCWLFIYQAHHASGYHVDIDMIAAVIWGWLTFVAIREALS